MKTLIIIPTMNVENTILQVVEDLNINAPNIDYLIVDYGSVDRTIALLDNNNIPYLSMPVSSKYKYALNVGMKYAKDQGYDSIIEYDGHNLYQAKYITNLLKIGYKHDLVLGSRFLDKEFQKKKKLICKIISWSIKLITKKKISDPTMRYRFYRINIIELFLVNKYWKSGPDTIAFLVWSGFSFSELSMELRYNPNNKHYSQSTELPMKRFMQGLKWIISIMFFQPFRKRIK